MIVAGINVVDCMYVNFALGATRHTPARATEGGEKKNNEWKPPRLEGPPAPAQADSENRGKQLEFRALYLLSGKHRSTLLRSCLEELAPKFNVSVHAEEFNIEQNVSHDLVNEGLQKQLLQRIEQGAVDALVTTPPCSTYSRVRSANLKGPPPVRSRDHFWGFPWLFGQLKHGVLVGNALTIFTAQILEAADEHKHSCQGVIIRTFLEHPEDLGGAWRQEDQASMVPASVWQWQRLHDVVDSSKIANFTVVSIRVAGVHHGLNLLASFQTSLNWNIGVNEAGHCLINTSPIKQSNDEQFRATGTSQYPAAMDRALVVAFLETLVTTPTTSPYKGWGAQVQQPRQDGQGGEIWQDRKETEALEEKSRGRS